MIRDSFIGRPKSDMSLTYTPWIDVQCSLKSLKSMRPLASRISTKGSAYLLKEAV